MTTTEAGGEALPTHEALASDHHVVAILDAGAQYGKVIDRRVRELGVMTETFPLGVSPEELEHVDAIIITGGPESVYSPTAPKFDTAILELGKPTLGICYGNQLIAQHFGGTVEPHGNLREDGPKLITHDGTSPLLSKLNQSTQVLMSHGDSVTKAPEGFSVTAQSGPIVAAMEDTERRMFGTQFHPEVSLTTEGNKVFENFLFGISKLESTYTMEDKIEAGVAEISNGVGDKDVYIALSGGVDSSVAFKLLVEAQRRGLVTGKIYAVHVDHGFMREGESADVKRYMADAGIDITVIDATETFAVATTTYTKKSTGESVTTLPLDQETDPENKRHIVGDTFMQIMDEFMVDNNIDPENTVLIQGTLRPDLIESASELASGSADTIKTHHNDTERVRTMRDLGNVIEPLMHLHKDEVRAVGKELGLPEEMVWRQPFPGPGLVIRILAAREAYLDRESHAISVGLEKFRSNEISAAVLPVRTVGVQGDGRTYSHLVALSGERNWQKLREMAREIPGKFPGTVNRVVYVFGDPIDGVLEDITPTLADKEAADQLRRADHAVNQVLIKHGLHRKLSQVPVVLTPVAFGEKNQRSIGIRTFITDDFMTGDFALPGEDFPAEIVDELVSAAMSAGGISRVMYDLTSKPPGTTEWE